jgi:hypothetical protein
MRQWLRGGLSFQDDDAQTGARLHWGRHAGRHRRGRAYEDSRGSKGLALSQLSWCVADTRGEQAKGPARYPPSKRFLQTATAFPTIPTADRASRRACIRHTIAALAS